MNSQEFDCIIIGGGLAGLTLAIQLVEKNKSVLLVEKEKYPFHRVCGEYISNESYPFLERLGVELNQMNLPKITEVKVSAPNGKSLLRKLDLGGFGISRFTLDSTLAVIARKKGVVLLEETKINNVIFENESFTVMSDSSSWRAKVVCGAYGKRSVIDQKLGRLYANRSAKKNYVAIKYHVKMDLPANRIELHNFKDGYCGISKVDGGRYCLCYLTDSSNLKESGNDIKTMEQQVLKKNPFLKKYFEEAEFLYANPLTISQITFGKKSLVENHLLMLGDAAGTIAPLCGNGMSMAMRGAFEAHQLIVQFLNGEISRAEMEDRHSRSWKHMFSTRVGIGNLIQYFFGNPLLTNFFISTLNTVPALSNQLIRATHGQPF